MTSAVVKRSVAIHGNKTSVSLEDELCRALKDLARSRTTLSDLVETMGGDRIRASNLSSAIRAYVLNRFRDQAQAVAQAGGRQDEVV
jgi:predicted DNA-binding ribbon-helix-helix protein